MPFFKGCYTASVTPMKKKFDVDYESLKRLVEFQVKQGVSGILACGTTGESATLTWEEHKQVIEKVHEFVNGKRLTIGGTGSNSTKEAMEGTRHAAEVGVEAVLLVDPYYNGPSSLEIRREYVEPIAKAFPDVQVIPYVIPGRTGTKLLPQDLAILHSQCSNVRSVKEATGDLENMKLTRKLCGSDFDILSGDDDKTFDMMTSPNIMASGVVSVTSNVAPRAVQQITEALLKKEMKKAEKLMKALKPLFQMVTVKTIEPTPYGERLVKARNPLAFKTLMNILGMVSSPVRRPLGKMTKMGLKKVLTQARTVQENNPKILEPIESFFDVNIEERLSNEKYCKGLTYA